MMAESDIHANLVDRLTSWVAREYCLGSTAAILVDRQGVIGPQRPPNIGGFVPDVYLAASAHRVIGEAKTSRDIETSHSESQLMAFLQYCGTTKGLFVLAVPWYRVPYAHNLLQRMCNRMCLSVRTFRILRDLPG